MIQFFVISYFAGLAVLIDSHRRPYHHWQHADRDRGYWAMTGIVLSVFGMGVVFAVLYLVLVVPRFGQDRRSTPEFARSRNRESVR